MEALFQGNPALAADVSAPDLKLEKNPEIKVLRWSGFVKSDEEIWNANTKRWEQETGEGPQLNTFPGKMRGPKWPWNLPSVPATTSS